MFHRIIEYVEIYDRFLVLVKKKKKKENVSHGMFVGMKLHGKLNTNVC